MAGRSQILSHTGLRGAAALSVVMYHLGFGAAYRLPSEEAIDIFERSYLFVDFFFLLSGFVLSYVYVGARAAPFTRGEARNFLVARIARVYPLHLLTLLILLVFHGALVCAAAAGLVGGPQAMPGTLAQFIGNVFLVQSWGFFAHEGWNVPAWSISTEFAAYLAFPLLLAALMRARAAAIALMAAASAGFYIFIGATSGDLDIVVGAAVLRCFAGFFLGVGLYLARNAVRGLTDGTLTAIQLAAATSMFALFEFTSNDPLLIIPFAMLVLFTWEDRGALARALGRPVMTKLGDWSYAIYLIHVPIIHILGFFYMRSIGRPGVLPEAADRILWIALVYAATIIAAKFLYEKFEMPARRALTRRFSARTEISRTDAPPTPAAAG